MQTTACFVSPLAVRSNAAAARTTDASTCSTFVSPLVSAAPKPRALTVPVATAQSAHTASPEPVPIQSLALTYATPIAPPRTAADAVVDSLLHNMSKHDGSEGTPDAMRSAMDLQIRTLIEYGDARRKAMEKWSALNDPLLCGSYKLVYSSSPNTGGASSSVDDYEPAGGSFNGPLAQLLFANRGTFKHVLSPDRVVNMVAFRMLGLLRGLCGTAGRMVPLPFPQAEGGEAPFGPDGVKIVFEPTRLRMFGQVFSLGGPTEVRVRPAYIDERVRIFVSARGSMYVFARDSSMDTTDSVRRVQQEWRRLFGPRVLAMPVWLFPILAFVIGFFTYFAPQPYTFVVRVAVTSVLLLAGLLIR